MIILRIVDFIFRVFSTVILVMILQISFAGQTLENYLIDFIRHSESTQLLREVTYSNIERLNLNIQVPEELPRRNLATVSDDSSSKSNAIQGLKKKISVGEFFSNLMKSGVFPSLSRVKKAKKDIKNIQKKLETVEVEQALKIEKSLSE